MAHPTRTVRRFAVITISLILVPLVGAVVGPSLLDARSASATGADQPARLLTFGHSYVAGLGASKPQKAWPEVVADSTCRSLVNEAGSGDISAETENQVLMADDTVLPTDVAVVETGINDVRLFGPDADLLNRYGRHLSEILTHLRAAQGGTAIPVLLVADPGIAGSAWGRYPPYNKGSQDLANRYAEKVHQVAAGFPNVSVVDVRSSWTAAHIHADGVHPNDSGHRLIADSVSSVLRSRDLSRCQPVTGIEIVGPDVIREPYGTATFSAVFTPVNSLPQALWSVTEPDGSPTDKAEIDVEGVLRVNHRKGDVLVTATAADGSGTKASKVVRLELDPDLLRSNAMAWPGVTISVSSEYNSDFGAEKLRDAALGLANTGDWASFGEQNPWLEVTWNRPIQADRIVWYDRAGIDDANGGTLSFSDGTTLGVSDIPPNGDAKTVTFGGKQLTSVRFQVEGGTGPNVGLAEFGVYAVPTAPEAPRDVVAAAGAGSATVSWRPPAFDGGAPITGYVVTPYRGDAALDPITVDEGATSVVVGQLTAGESYTFTVIAKNMSGSGPESQPSNVVQPR